MSVCLKLVARAALFPRFVVFVAIVFVAIVVDVMVERQRFLEWKIHCGAGYL